MTVLDDIVAGAREDLAARRRRVPERELRQRAAARGPGVDRVPLPRAVHGRPRIIAEVKRAGPSRGPLARIADPAALAAAYERGGAAAVSVLTERRRFGGGLADLDAVRARVALPVLCEDSVVDPYRVWEARAHGADLVLLIVAALDQPLPADLTAPAAQAGLTPLVETHDEAEAGRAPRAGARVIGVDARDPRTLRVDRATFGRIAPLLPGDIVRVAESGVRPAADVAGRPGLGADAVPVGEASVTSGDGACAVAALAGAA